MYPAAFRYHRARTLEEAAAILAEVGDEAMPLAGGQSLIPLMKLRFVRPALLVDLNWIPKLSEVDSKDGTIHIGALARHAQLAESEMLHPITILHDCAAGIADTQVRSRGTIGGSLQTLFGGNISLYASLCERARDDAFKQMLAHAGELGANAIVGVRYDATEIAPGITEVLCYGTAVFVEPVG